MIIASNLNVFIFSAGMGFIYAQQLRDDPHRVPISIKRFGAGLSVE